MLTLLALIDDEDERQRFAVLYDRYKASMYDIAFLMLKEAHASEDVVHDSFVRIINAFDKVKALSGSDLDGYIVVIVKNTAINAMKKRKREVFQDELIVPCEDEIPIDVDAIAQVIRSMPETYRRVLELRFILEYSNREIARELGISVSAVEQRISRGRKLLQDRLRKEGIVNG